MLKTPRQLELERINTLPTIEIDPHGSETGVLLSDEIKFYVQHGKMIEPFLKCNLKAAGYELTVGDQAMLGGKYISLEKVAGQNRLRIPSFEVAVIKTEETINLPRFIIGRWNIRVAWAYKGLLWVGGPQVDPGFVGHLFCPIYNLSNKDVIVKRGDRIALMDFVKTTSYHPAKTNSSSDSKDYPRPPKRVTIDDYEIDDFRSALFSHGTEMKEGLKSVQIRFDTFIIIIFAILAILMTALAYLNVGSPKWESGTRDLMVGLWEAVPLAAALFAVVLAILAYCSLSRPILNKPLALLIGTIVGGSGALGYMTLIHPALF